MRAKHLGVFTVVLTSATLAFADNRRAPSHIAPPQHGPPPVHVNRPPPMQHPEGRPEARPAEHPP
jgi:hypothetical protein